MDETARFNLPGDIAINDAGDLYVLDRGNHDIRHIAAEGEVSTLPGLYDGAKMAMDVSGNMFVLAGTDILKVTPAGNSTSISGYPAEPGSYTPLGLSVDAQGRLYVLLEYRNTVAVDRIDPDNSRRQVYSFVTYGTAEDIASDAQGNLAILSAGPQEGVSSITFVPQSAQPGNASSAGISSLALNSDSYGKMVFDAAGNLYMAAAHFAINSGSLDSYSVSDMAIVKIAPDRTISTILNGFPDGSTTTRQTTGIWGIGIAVDPSGNVFVADPFENAIYRIGLSKQVTLIAGEPGEAGNSD